MYDGYVSVDLGQRHDYTAVIVAEEAVWIGARPALPAFPTQDQLLAESLHDGLDRSGWTPPSLLNSHQRRHFRTLTNSGGRPGRPPLMVRHIERVRDRSYTDVVSEVAALLGRAPLSEMDVALLVDAGGVGVAVLDLMRQRGLRPWSITATGGDQINVPEHGVIRCPKRELVSAAQITLAEGRLRIAAGLADAPTLTKELQNYQVKISQSGHDSYAAREGEHDDLVYAAAQLCFFRDWYSQHYDDAIAAADRVPVTQE